MPLYVARSLRVLTEVPLAPPGVVYRSAMPYSTTYDPQGEVLPEALRLGVRVVVVLVSREECVAKTGGKDLLALYREHGLEVLAFPIADFEVPEELRLGAFAVETDAQEDFVRVYAKRAGASYGARA